VNGEHSYEVTVEWKGNRGTGTSDYRSYGRENLVTAEGKPPIDGSADRVFRGTPDRWNPEEMLLAALSQCHLLSYLYVAASRGVVVTAYTDSAAGTIQQTSDDGGHFTSVTLHPVVTVEGGADPAAVIALAESLHREASEKCFIAASVNFPVRHEPRILTA
jgi:organic hydroperoxide reductase OsmC/OhrA